jgi:hypothetical protein
MKFLWINHTADAYYREIAVVAQNTSHVLENKIFHTHRKKGKQTYHSQENNIIIHGETD